MYACRPASSDGSAHSDLQPVLAFAEVNTSKHSPLMPAKVRKRKVREKSCIQSTCHWPLSCLRAAYICEAEAEPNVRSTRSSILQKYFRRKAASFVLNSTFH